MNMSNERKLSALKCALKKNTETLAAGWEFSKRRARDKSEYEGEPKTELDLVLDAYAAFNFACCMTALEILENEKLIVVSPSLKHEAALRLASTPIVLLGTKGAIDEILTIAKKTVEIKEEADNG